MRYTFFEFINFRGVRHARIDLGAKGTDARIHALVGLNESGKTTVLAAIDQFRSSDEEEIAPKQLGGWLEPDPQTFIPVAERANFNGKIRIRCGIEVSDEDFEAAQKSFRKLNGFRLQELGREIQITDVYEYADSVFQRRQSYWTGLVGSGMTKQGTVKREIKHNTDGQRWALLTHVIRSRLPAIWYFPHFLFDFPEKIYIEPRDGDEDAVRFYRGLFQDVLDALSRDLDVSTHVVERFRSTKTSDQDNMKQVLLDASRHVTTTIVASWNKIFADKKIASDKRVIIEIGSDLPEPPPPGADSEDLPGRVWVRFRLEDTDGTFSISERSLGFRWFFVYLLLTTYSGGSKQNENGVLFLFDEPASNLHPKAQAALLSSLGGLSERGAIIYTTHSHHLIEPTWLENTYVVTNQGLDPEAISPDFTNTGTDIQITPYRQFAATHPDQSHFFQPILDVLDYAPSQLELVPSAVMVEGKNDFYLLSYAQDVLFATKPEDRLHLMPSGGAGTLDDLMSLYLGWSRPFVALLDSDKEGRTQASRYEEVFGRIISDRVLLLGDVIGNDQIEGIETLLTDEDRLNFQRVVDQKASKFNKKTFWLGVQEALVTKREVILSAASETSLTTVLTAVRERLGLIAQD